MSLPRPLESSAAPRLRCPDRHRIAVIQRLIFPLLLAVTRLPAADDPFQFHQDVLYLGPDRVEKMDIYIPLGGPRPLPVVLYIHGGAWGGGDKAWAVEKPNCVALAREGYAVASINYKLNPKGTTDAYPQNIFDCKTAIRFLRKEAATYSFDAQ